MWCVTTALARWRASEQVCPALEPRQSLGHCKVALLVFASHEANYRADDCLDGCAFSDLLRIEHVHLLGICLSERNASKRF